MKTTLTLAPGSTISIRAGIQVPPISTRRSSAYHLKRNLPEVCYYPFRSCAIHFPQEQGHDRPKGLLPFHEPHKST